MNPSTAQASDLLSRLTRQADQETQPPLDVTQQVLHRLARERYPVVDRRLAIVLACACSLSALGLGVLMTAKPVRDPVISLSTVATRGTGSNALWKLLEQ